MIEKQFSLLMCVCPTDNGIATSLSEIVRMVESIIGRELSTQRDVSKDVGAPRVIVLNSQKLQTEVDWLPSIRIETGLKDFFRD